MSAPTVVSDGVTEEIRKSPDALGNVEVEKVDEIDFGGDDIDFTAGAEPDNAEISAIFHEPLPADDPNQSFFNQPANTTATTEQTTSSSSSAETSNESKKKKKKKKGKKTDDDKKQQKSENVASAVAEQRGKLREKLRNRMAMQKEVGGRGMQLMNQVGMTLDEVTQDSGNMSRSKQDQIMNRTKGMLGNAFKGLDSKQKNVLAKKTDEVADMASNLMKKLLSGPGSSGSSSSKKKKEKMAKSAGASLLDDDKEDMDKEPTLSSTFDNEIDELARAVHEKPVKQSKPKHKPTAQPTELPLRPRHRDNKGASSETPLAKPETTAASKKQKKYRKKREKIKQLLKSKNSSQPTATTTISEKSAAIPQLIPADDDASKIKPPPVDETDLLISSRRSGMTTTTMEILKPSASGDEVCAPLVPMKVAVAPADDANSILLLTN